MGPLMPDQETIRGQLNWLDTLRRRLRVQIDQQGKLESIQEYVDTLQEAEVSGRTERAVEELRIPHPAI